MRANAVKDKADHLDAFRNDSQLIVPQIFDAVSMTSAAKFSAVTFISESDDAVCPFFLQIFIEDLIFDHGYELLVEL